MNLLAKNETPAQRRTITPRYNVKETTDAFVLTAFVPGVNRPDIETQIDRETLTVSARRTWTPPAEWTTVHRETPDVDYRLVINLNDRFNREAVRAELNQGVLTLTLPKAEAVKPRRIEIAG